jgi:hypothetical protein
MQFNLSEPMLLVLIDIVGSVPASQLEKIRHTEPDVDFTVDGIDASVMLHGMLEEIRRDRKVS